MPTIRRAGRSGAKTGSPGARGLPAGAEATTAGRVPRTGLALTLVALGAVSLTIGTAVSSHAPSQEEVQAFSGGDQTRALMYQATSAMDTEALLHRDGQELPQDEDGNLPSQALIEQALADDPDTLWRDEITTFHETLAATDDSNPVRTATVWSDGRAGAQYVVPTYELREAREALAPSNSGFLWTAAALFALAALVLALGQAWVAAALTALALVPTGVVVATDPLLRSAYSPAAERHEQSSDSSRTVSDQVRQDLEVVFGLRVLRSYDEPTQYSGGYWDRDTYLAEVSDEFVQARLALGQALDGDPAEVTPAALALVEAGAELQTSYEDEAAQARAEIVQSTQDRGATWPRWLAWAFAVVLPLGGHLVESRRRRTA